MLGSATAADPASAPASLAVWDHSIDLRAGVGYKDNILFGSANHEGSPFEDTGLDLMLLRLSTSGTLFNFFLTGDDIRYFHAPDVDKEQTLLSQAQLKKDLGPDWKAALTVQYFYENQIYDASITETNFTAVQARGHNLSLGPALRRELGHHYWVELAGNGQRQWFAAPLESYWQGGPKLTVGRDLSQQSDLTLSYSWERRVYINFNEIALDETPIAGTTAAFWIQQAELAWHRNWDAQRHWRTVTRLIYLVNQDNGPGFFNYHEYRLVQQLRYQARPWQFEARAAVSRYEFDRQTVSLADLSTRHRTDATFSVRGERRLTRALRAFAEYAYERSVSNLAFDQYHVNQILGGLDWEF
ncbi:MAG: hypothetical protein KGS61_09350 [Verrucomicrobia bacterium]|nr:hypothetical protein [Verrucomicrobiota bacterium]